MSDAGTTPRRPRRTPRAKGLVDALHALQAELPFVHKGKTATVRGKDGGATYTYRYADLPDVAAALQPLLTLHGLVFTSRPTLQGDRFVLAYRLRHLASGEEEAGEWPLPQGSPQQIGSAITYARRYVLCCLTGLVPDEDDDAAQTAGTTSERPAPPAGPSTPADFLAAMTQEGSLARVHALRQRAGELELLDRDVTIPLEGGPQTVPLREAFTRRVDRLQAWLERQATEASNARTGDHPHERVHDGEQ